MAKLIVFTVLSLLLFSCNNPECGTQQEKSSPNQAAACPTPDPKPDPLPEPDPDEGEEVPHEALIFDANVDLYNFERLDEDKLLKAIEIIKKVIATKEFRNKVIGYTYQGKRTFVDNKGLTNEQIYQILLDGKEDLLPVVDNEMDLQLELYYSWSSTVGYTTPGSLRIFMNTKFFDNYTPAEVAGNVFHEWIHKLGFNHDSSYSVSRDSSVPYAIGYIMRDLGRKYE